MKNECRDVPLTSLAGDLCGCAGTVGAHPCGRPPRGHVPLRWMHLLRAGDHKGRPYNVSAPPLAPRCGWLLCVAFFILHSSFFISSASAQTFDELFDGRTLRIDYIFAGDKTRQEVYVDRLNVMPGWYGKRRRMAEVPVEGNGQITMCDRRTGAVIYRHSFSTLFQEWLSYDEALATPRAFENVFLVPMPRDTAEVSITLMDNRRDTVAQMTHTIVPGDILIRHIGRQTTPYITLQQAADTTRCIHIAFIAEGYTTGEMSTFESDAREAMEAIFSHEPFRSMRKSFNIIAVEAVSEESGTSEPSAGIWRRTALSSHFDTFYSDRYLTTLNIQDLHDLLAGTPYEHIIVLVNTEKYGGGGILNSYNLAMAHHRLTKPVVVHEFGHSFAGLADEYAYENEPIPMYPHDVEPWEPNITTLVSPEGKWDVKGSLYEGAGYSLTGVYRAEADCRMRTNECEEFCTVCRGAIQKLIEFYVNEE